MVLKPSPHTPVTTAILAGIQAFRVPTRPNHAASGLYYDGVTHTGGTGHLSSATAGFGLLGLCFAAKLGRIPPSSAAARDAQAPLRDGPHYVTAHTTQ